MPAALEAWLQAGWITDLILLILLAETAALVWRVRCARAPAVAVWLPQLLAGAALVLALRFSLPTDDPGPTSALLVLAGLAHLAGYRARWYR